VVKLSSPGLDLYAVWRGDLAGDYVLVLINFTPDAVTAALEDDTLPVTDLNSLNPAFTEGYRAEGLEFTLAPAGYAVLYNK
jgi:hypothetical protein